MSCREHEDTILDVARGVAGDLETAALLRHAGECPACGQRLQRERALTAGLRALDEATPGDAASPGVETALLAAFAAQAPARSGAEPRRGDTWRAWMAAAAALVLVVLGTVMVRREVAAPKPGGEPLLAARPVEASRELNVLKPPVEGRSVRERGPVVRTSGDGLPGAFVAWPGAAALPAFENGELVRTELPASVLPLLGIAGASPEAQETVPVDVVVGQDGFARAVRLARR